jgi:uncharacterized protein (TIGR02646 family)
MRRLDRNKVPEPLCLQEHKNRSTDNWDDVSHSERKEIRAALREMQDSLCAYCESSVETDNSCHIEHFRSRDDFHKLIFEWSNLFLSCNSKDSCGHHKDKQGQKYEANELINPCKDNPDDFLKFYSNGCVEPRDKNSKKATETIRVFKLNSPRLINARRNVIRSLESQFNISILADIPESELLAYFEAMLSQSQPYKTAIRHVFFEAPA